MEFLPQQNKVNQGDVLAEQILATGKHVIVIGGGDTGSDCTGTSNRHGCASLTQFELFPAPPDVGQFPRAAERPASSPWPYWPIIFRTSTSHEEGCDRQFSIETKEFIGDESGGVSGLPRCRSSGSRTPTDGRASAKCRAPKRCGRRSWCCWRWALVARKRPA